MVALQALALYATLLFEKGGATTVLVTSPEGLLRFDVNQANKLLYQEKELKNVVGTYKIQAVGTASAAVQVCDEHSNRATSNMTPRAKPSKPPVNLKILVFKSRMHFLGLNIKTLHLQVLTSQAINQPH